VITTKGFYETEFRPDGTIWIPSEIVLQGREPDCILRWQAGGNRFVRPKDEMLDDFLLLGRASDEKVLRYAKTWGVLGICKHGLPYSHNPSTGAIAQSWNEIIADSMACGPVPIHSARQGVLHPLEFQESLADWRKYSQAARSICNIHIALDSERIGDLDDWQTLFNFPAYSRLQVPWWDQDVITEWFILIRTLNEWLRWGGVRPVFNGVGKNLWGVCLGRKGLFGALACQIMRNTCLPHRVMLCSGCKTVFTAMKQRSVGRRQYCRECRERKVPGRDAAHDYRARQKKQPKNRGKWKTP
jgi:hypothetical protein